VFGLLRLSDQSVLLYTDEGFGTALAEALTRFRIRVKVEIVDRGDTWGVLSVRGDTAAALAAGVTAPVHVVAADWPTVRGADLIGPVDALAAARDELVAGGAIVGDVDTYERMRIEAGVPRQGVDIDEKTIPQEAFLERDTVSFTKGCFLGQELVCRIDTRGHVNKYLRRLELHDAVPDLGADVVAGDRSVGTVTSVAATPGGAVALATLRKEVEPPATVDVRWGDVSAEAAVTSV
jgi:folate-binding protein YgfZ